MLLDTLHEDSAPSHEDPAPSQPPDQPMEQTSNQITENESRDSPESTNQIADIAPQSGTEGTRRSVVSETFQGMLKNEVCWGKKIGLFFAVELLQDLLCRWSARRAGISPLRRSRLSTSPCPCPTPMRGRSVSHGWLRNTPCVTNCFDCLSPSCRCTVDACCSATRLQESCQVASDAL